MSWERVVLEVMMRVSKIVELQTSLTTIPKSSMHSIDCPWL